MVSIPTDCSFDGCTFPPRAKTLCRKHYDAERRALPLTPEAIARKAEQRRGASARYSEKLKLDPARLSDAQRTKKAYRAQDYVREQAKEYTRKYREIKIAEDPKYNTKSSRKWYYKKYGITEEIYFELVELQGNTCAICKTDKPSTKSEAWFIDHDHVTGKVRGLLCTRCNTGIGMLQDDVRVVQAAMDYLHNPPVTQLQGADPVLNAEFMD